MSSTITKDFHLKLLKQRFPKTEEFTYKVVKEISFQGGICA